MDFAHRLPEVAVFGGLVGLVSAPLVWFSGF